MVVGHPGHKRVVLFQEALARRGLPAARVVAWRDLLSDRADLGAAVGPAALVRLESPGQDFEVERLLLAAGADSPEIEDTAASFLPADAARQLRFDRGRLRYPRQWYRGFRTTLRRLARELADHAAVRWMNHPEDVIELFDKRRCQERFAAAGLPVPRGLGCVRSFDELMARMAALRCWRVFVKLACGSSASGVVAFRTNGPRMEAITTVEMARVEGEPRLYNSRRIQRYEAPAEIRLLIDTLCHEGVQVEEWIPKAALDGQIMDVRAVVVVATVAHVVPRLSQTPLTNLHLLNQRGSVERLREVIPMERWQSAEETCRRVAALFPRCGYLGVDLLFTPSFRRHAVLEANAFGDLLPGILWNGLDTYEAELALLCPRRSGQVSIRG